MKPLLLAFFLAATLHAQEAAAEPGARTFTSTDGRKLTATIIEKTDTTVTVRRAEDGKDFTLPLERLGAPDQAFVKAWGTQPAEPEVSPGGLVKTWMLEPQWDGVGLFGDGLAPVKLGGKWGYIDEAGKMVIPTTWDEALSFADGLAPVQKDGKWGYIDKTGKVVVEPTWDAAEVFSSGAAKVRKSDKFGFINETGVLISEPKWTQAEPYAYGLAVVDTAHSEVDGTQSVINLNGETVFEQPRRRSSNRIKILEHGICVVDNEKWEDKKQIGKPRARYLNLEGKILFEQSVDTNIEFHEGLAAVWVNEDQLAFIDTTGTIVIPPFKVVRNTFFVPAHRKTPHYHFSEGLAVVPRAALPGEKGDQELIHGYMDKTGKMVISARWAQAGPFSEGLALVSESVGNEPGTWSIINKTGAIVAPVAVATKASSWDGSRRIPAFQNGLVPLYGPNGSHGRCYIDHAGRVAIPPVFEFAGGFLDGVAVVELVNLRSTDQLLDKSIIDTAGAVVVPITRQQSNQLTWLYREVGSKAALIPAASPRSYGFVNRAGEVVVPPSWDDAEVLSPDLVAYRANGTFGLVNATGQPVPSPTTEEIERFESLSPNLIGFYVSGKLGLFNNKGEVLLPATVENIDVAHYQDEQSVLVRQGRQWGLLEIRSGQITPTEPSFASLGASFPGNFSTFEENGFWGVRTKDGTVLVPSQFGGMSQVSTDRFWVKMASGEGVDTWGLMTQTGELLTPFEWQGLGRLTMFSDGLLLVAKRRAKNTSIGGVSGYMNESGKLVIPLSPGSKSNFAHGAAMVWNGKESGLINPQGEWIFKSSAEVELSEIGFTSSFAGHFQHGLALIEAPLKWGFVKLTQTAK